MTPQKWSGLSSNTIEHNKTKNGPLGYYSRARAPANWKAVREIYYPTGLLRKEIRLQAYLEKSLDTSAARATAPIELLLLSIKTHKEDIPKIQQKSLECYGIWEKIAEREKLMIYARRKSRKLGQ